VNYELREWILRHCQGAQPRGDLPSPEAPNACQKVVEPQGVAWGMYRLGSGVRGRRMGWPR
jgi:hypothetical protein